MTAVEITANGCLTAHHEERTFPLCGGRVFDLPSALAERLVSSGVAVRVDAEADESDDVEDGVEDEAVDEDDDGEPLFDELALEPDDKE